MALTVPVSKRQMASGLAPWERRYEPTGGLWVGRSLRLPRQPDAADVGHLAVEPNSTGLGYGTPPGPTIWTRLLRINLLPHALVARLHVDLIRLLGIGAIYGPLIG